MILLKSIFFFFLVVAFVQKIRSASINKKMYLEYNFKEVIFLYRVFLSIRKNYRNLMKNGCAINKIFIKFISVMTSKYMVLEI